MTALKITYNLCFITHHVESRQQLSVSSWSFVDSISEQHKYANLPRNQNTQSTLVDQIINVLTGKREKNWQKWKRLKPRRGYCNVPQNDANCHISGFLGVKLVCYDGMRCKLAVHNGKNDQMTPLRITSGVAYIAAKF